MTLRLAILCSGQGGQAATMLPLLQSDALAWQSWQALEAGWREAGVPGAAGVAGAAGAAGAVASVAGVPDVVAPHFAPVPGYAIDSHDFPAWQVLLQQDSRFQNRYAQVLVVAFGLAAWQALQPVLPQPALVAGYSVGEMTALAVAGALEPHAVLALTRQRAMLMDWAASLARQGIQTPDLPVMDAVDRHGIEAACAPDMRAAGEQGLLALSGTPWRALAAHILAAGAFIAIDNGEQSCVLGGYRSVLASLVPHLRAQGGQTQEIAVSVAAHTPLLAAAGTPFLQLLQQQIWQRARCPALAALDARRLIRFDTACASMAQALHDTIHWADAMDALAEGGIGVALELGPGSSLTRMLQQRHPGIACRSLADFRSLQAAREWLARQLAA